MALKKILTTAPPAELTGYYKKSGEQWLLDVEGEEDDGKLKEFRAENIKLRQQLEAAVSEQGKIKETLEKLSPKEKAAADEPQTLTGRVEHLTKLVETERGARLAAEKRAKISSWERDFGAAASKAKVRDESASKVLLALAKETFREDEKTGAFVALDEKGLARYSPKSTDPYSVDDFLEEQKAGPYRDLFAQPQGGGGRGSGSGILAGITAKKTVPAAQAGDHIDSIAAGETAIEGRT